MAQTDKRLKTVRIPPSDGARNGELTDGYCDVIFHHHCLDISGQMHLCIVVPLHLGIRESLLGVVRLPNSAEYHCSIDPGQGVVLIQYNSIFQAFPGFFITSQLCQRNSFIIPCLLVICIQGNRLVVILIPQSLLMQLLSSRDSAKIVPGERIVRIQLQGLVEAVPSII